MKRLSVKIRVLAVWAVCIGMLPLVAAGLFFQPYYIFPAAIVFVLARYVWPFLVRKTRFKTFRSAVFVTEAFMVLLTLVYYTSDNRGAECRFEIDDRLVPLVTFRQCLETPEDQKTACMKVGLNPYDLALYEGELLVVSGRNETTLGILNPDNPGEFKSELLGDGNIQQIVVKKGLGHAVMPMWKDKRLMIYDLENLKSIVFNNTGVGKLIGAEKYGEDIYVLSELPYLYKVATGTYDITEYKLPYSLNNLYEIKADHKRGAFIFTDWVGGIVYRYSAKNMAPDLKRYLGGVVTGVAIDEDLCELYVSNGIPGFIKVLDCETLVTIKSFWVGFGGHELALSKDDEKIYLVKYFGGKFTEIDRRTGKVLDEFPVGGQTRSLLYDEESDRLFLVSTCGIFEVKLDSK